MWSINNSKPNFPARTKSNLAKPILAVHESIQKAFAKELTHRRAGHFPAGGSTLLHIWLEWTMLILLPPISDALHTAKWHGQIMCSSPRQHLATTMFANAANKLKRLEHQILVSSCIKQTSCFRFKLYKGILLRQFLLRHLLFLLVL